MNRIIVVTGGAAGIGRCTVEYFASKGDRIYFIDNNQDAYSGGYPFSISGDIRSVPS